MAKIQGEELNKYIEDLVARSRAAQEEFEAKYTTNRAVDEVIRAIGMAAVEHTPELAADALSETGMGTLDDKVNKLASVALMEWEIMKGRNTIEPETSPLEPDVLVYPKPMGVVGAIMPSTNPCATIIGNAMMAIKGRNSIIIAPHPASVNVSDKEVAMLRKALKDIGAPEDLLLGIGAEAASIEATTLMMKLCDINLATGGAGMVKAVYSSGKPGIGVGQGNAQQILDKDMTDADFKKMIADTIDCRTYDNGVPCTGTQTVHVPEEMEDKFVKGFEDAGCYIAKGDEIDKLRDLIFPEGKARLNRAIVGKKPSEVAKMAGFDIPEDSKLIVLKNQAWGTQDLLCREILFPILRYTTYQKFEDAVDRAVTNLKTEGAGHSSSIWSNNQDHIEYAAKRIPVGRFHINQPTVGKDNGLIMTITVGCGTWGGTSISENVAYYHLLNKTKVTRTIPNINPYYNCDWDSYEPHQLIPDQQ